MWDLWGLNTGNFKSGEFKMVAKGVLPETGWDMNMKLRDQVEWVQVCQPRPLVSCLDQVTYTA